MDVDRKPSSHEVTAKPGHLASTACEGVLLVDLENMVGQNAKPRSIASRMQVLIRCAGPGVEVVAACARDRITPEGARVLHEHDVALLTVDGTKDAADEALLAEAHRLASIGCRRFVVASNDSTFARLAMIGDLEIVIWTTQNPRENYTARASQVHRLPLPTAAAAFSGTAPATACSSAPARASTHAPPASMPAGRPLTAAPHATTCRQPTRLPSTPPPVHPLSWGRLVSAGAGLVAAGILFGSGAALGVLAVHRQPRCPNRDR